MNHVIFATDSRGAKLKKYLDENHHFGADCKAHVYVMPGGKIHDVGEKIKQKVANLRAATYCGTIMAVIAAGICNLTEKITHAGGVQICYMRMAGKVEFFLKELHDISEYFHSISVVCQIACVPPASIVKYAEFNVLKGRLQYSSLCKEEIQIQQKHLEEDIKIINNEIQGKLDPGCGSGRSCGW